MADKAELRARVTLNSTAFQRGLKAISRDVALFRHSVVDPFATFGSNLGHAALVAGTTAAAGLGLAFHAAYHLSDEIDDLAKRSGMGADELSKLAYAAKGMGVDAGAIAKAFAGFSKGDQAKSGASFMSELRRVSEIVDPVERARSAIKAFGKKGMEMVVLLDGGWAKLQARMAEAARLGVVISPAQTASVTAMAQAWSRLKASMTGLSLRLFSFDSIAVALNRVTDGVVRLGRSSGFRLFADSLSGMVGEGVQWLDRLGQAWQMLAANQREQLTGMLGGSAAFIVAWKAGLVVPFVQGVGGMVAAFWRFPRAVLGGLTAVTGFLAGLSIGKVLEDAFQLSSWLLHVKAVFMAVTRVIEAGMNAVLDTVSTVGAEIGKALRNPFDTTLTKRAASMKLGLGRVLESYDMEVSAAMRNLSAKENAIWSTHDTIAADRRGDKRGLGQRLKDALREAMGDVGDLAMPDAFRAFLDNLRATSPGALPNVPEVMGLGTAAIQAADVADSLERAGRAAKTPLRGAVGQFLTGGRNRYGSRGDSVLPFADRMVSAAVLSGRQPAITVDPVVAEQRRTNTILAVMSTNLANSTMGLQGLAWGG